MVVDDGDDFLPLLMFVSRVPDAIPPFGHGVGPVAMQHAQVEFLGFSEMPYTGHKRLPERPIIGPFRKDFVDGRVVDGRVTIDVFRYGQTLPLHPGVEHPQDEVKDPVIAQFALRSPLGGAAGKAANLVGCESPRRQLPDSDGEHIRGTAREQTGRCSDVKATAAPSLDEARR